MPRCLKLLIIGIRRKVTLTDCQVILYNTVTDRIFRGETKGCRILSFAQTGACADSKPKGNGFRSRSKSPGLPVRANNSAPVLNPTARGKGRAALKSRNDADKLSSVARKKNVSEDLETGRLSMSYGLDWKDKKYLEPWEVREIGTDEFLLFAAGKNGVHRGARRSYLDTPEFKGKYSPDPYHQAGRKPG